MQEIQGYVTSNALDWYGGPANEDALTFLGRTQRKYDVHITLQHQRGMSWFVTVTGAFSNVYRCIDELWASNEPPGFNDQRRDYVLSLMGDKVALARWDTGNYDDAGNYADRPEVEESYDQKMRWADHWAHASWAQREQGIPEEHIGGGERPTEVAIDMLARCGYEPNVTDKGGDYDPTTTAQSYLELAFAHAPELMDMLEWQMDLVNMLGKLDKYGRAPQ